MKRNFVRVLSFVFFISIIFSLAGCSKDSKASKDTAAAAAATTSSEAQEKTAKEKPTLKIGSKNFTEEFILSEIYSLALEDAGFKVERKFNIAGSLIHSAITSKEIDLYPEYTGTGLLTVLKLPLITDPQKVYDKVKEEYKSKFNIVWLDYSPATDSNGLVLNKAISDQYNIKTISDLQKNADKIRFASQGEFEQRDDGLPGLEKVYGPFKFKSIKVFDNALKYEVLSKDQADLAVAYTTEGALSDPKYVVLEDDKKFWPPYNIAPIVRQEVLDANPEIKDVLNKISSRIDTKTITKLNAEVDIKKREVEEVAKEFYNSIK